MRCAVKKFRSDELCYSFKLKVKLLVKDQFKRAKEHRGDDTLQVHYSNRSQKQKGRVLKKINKLNISPIFFGTTDKSKPSSKKS